MSYTSSLTPCPIPYRPHQLQLQDQDDSTLNFTSALLHKAKPRRPRASVAFAIHDDNNNSDRPSATQEAECITLLKPARRNVSTLISKPTPQAQPSLIPSSSIVSTIQPLRRPPNGSTITRPAARLSTLPEDEINLKDTPRPERAPPKLGRPARRGTLFVPNDDTTMPSMYMGVFSPIKQVADGLSPAPGSRHEDIEVTGIAAQMVAKRISRRSLAAAPRRLPLQATVNPVHENLDPTDRFGQGGGKENVPPGLEECEKQMLDLKLDPVGKINTGRTRAPNSYKTLPPTRQQSPMTSRASSSNGHLPRSSPDFKSTFKIRQKSTVIGWNQERAYRPSESQTRLQSSLHKPDTKVVRNPKVPTRIVLPIIRPVSIAGNHAVTPNNALNSAMYEDDWLSHQEIAITQLVNSLFDASQAKTNPVCDVPHLRYQLQRAYTSEPSALVFKRLDAALKYGSLSIPRETLAQGTGLYRDLGRRRQFIDFWVQSYDHTALELALEVVVGRRLRASSPDTLHHGAEQVASGSELESYIRAFLLQNEDGRPDGDSTSRASWSYQRTVHRSLMLISALDLLKTISDIDFNARLFRPSSSFKSSSSAVQILMQMLNSAVGDPVRALSFVGYQVSHTQSALSEFQYSIDNIAVDMRGGIRLTRLVELLLYPEASRHSERVHDQDATTTVIMPDGESFDFQNGQQWPLSQHLKLSCQARALKVWNVHVALSALKNVKGIAGMIDGITAEDIVDGYREKTIRLLWALVGRWGVAGLVNWDDVRWETKRLLSQARQLTKDDDDDDDDQTDTDHEDGIPSQRTCHTLLRKWARAVLLSQNYPISNLNTTFSSTTAFTAIVTTYAPFLAPSSPISSSSSTAPPTLRARLKSLGCSTEFANLFSSANAAAHVFDRDFTMAALAFLASRLLAPTRQVRAAVVV